MSSRVTVIKLPNTLSFRLTFCFASTFLVCLVAALLALYVYLGTVLNSRMDDDLKEDISEFRELWRDGGLDRVISEITREMNSSDQSEVFFRLLDLQGTVVFSSDVSEWEGLEDETASMLPIHTVPFIPILETVEFPRQEYPVRIVLGQIGPDMVLQIGETLEKKEEIMELLFKVFAGMVFLGIPLASGVGWAIARKAVNGIEEVSRAAKDLERGDLDRQVTVKAREEEIQTLMKTFNSMAARIRGLIHEMREMTDNIAHDLRSPLARIRAISEGALAGTNGPQDYKVAAADTLKECDRLIHLINTTLDMAEVDAGVTNGAKGPVDLSQLMCDLCELFEAVAEEKHIAFKVSVEPNCHIWGIKSQLQRMVVNLLDNAMKYTPAEGQVSIELTHSPHNCLLTITDTGVGIPLSDQPRVFDRFFRCDHSRSQEGSGLGLSFARSVARAHGGDIIVTSDSSHGCIFTSTFPVASSAA
jgi:signal transduction histidine kinase